MEILKKQLQSVIKTDRFKFSDMDPDEYGCGVNLINHKDAYNISEASYEAAIIGAAIELEKKAIEYYSSRAKETLEEAEEKLFLFLANWEMDHMKLLAKLDQEIKEQIWYDNNFWPLD